MNATMYEEAKIRGACRAVDSAVESIGYMGIALADGDLNQARDLNRQASDAAQRARRYLLASLISHDASGEITGTVTAPISLPQLSTPDTRELLDLLTRAQAVADRVDIARGRAVDPFVELLPGESRGTDLAEAISEIALRVRIEVQGPQGHD